MDKDEQIKQLKAELEYYKKNSVMICGMSDEDDDGEEAEELGVKDGETFFNFDEEGFGFVFAQIIVFLKIQPLSCNPIATLCGIFIRLLLRKVSPRFKKNEPDLFKTLLQSSK